MYPQCEISQDKVSELPIPPLHKNRHCFAEYSTSTCPALPTQPEKSPRSEFFRDLG